MTESGAQKSTIVRAESDRRVARRRAARRRRAALQLAVVRARLGLLQRIAPRRAAQHALDLWATPPDGAGRRRDDRPAPGTLGSVTTDGGSHLVVETWSPPSGPVPAEVLVTGAPTAVAPSSGSTPGGTVADLGAVYLVHGWGGWRGQLGAFVEPLRAAGYRVVAFDALSHGDSGPGRFGPRRSTVPEMAESLAAVVRVHGEPTAVVAHSLGTATTTLAVRDGLEVGRLVLVAAITDPLGELERFADALRLAAPTRALLRALILDVAGRPLSDLDVLDTVRSHPLPPALVVHDRADKEVPFEVGAALAAAWPEGELLATDGLGHHRLLRDPTVVRTVVDYLAPVGVRAAGVGDA
ncbi:alpha/beta fold hydrolase [Cellulosimicrobium sp. Marseille-Q4280]|uniref:alpha/beta fold hydrolase n=1 Tax=Cellulosimicrobium sp. Marseille-Q4280 TaxID=2937992 RepID=UPI00203F817E|nr:alpha/beta fold hydrolase [Cellulosimicrobium sp. Marseille-Q4280]